MAELPTHRASDAEREEVAERLRDAAGAGRLEPHELEERLEGGYSAPPGGEVARAAAAPPPRPARAAAGAGPPRPGVAVGGRACTARELHRGEHHLHRHLGR